MDSDTFAELQQRFKDAEAERRDPGNAGSWPVLPDESHLQPGETVEQAHLRIQKERGEAPHAD